MISQKDIPFFNVAMPLAVGLVAWYGLNFAWIAPNVIAPRLAEKHYLPSCVANVEKISYAVAQDFQTRTQQAARAAEEAARRAEQASKQQLANFWGALFQGRPGGQAFLDHYSQPGRELDAINKTVTGNAVAVAVQEQGQKLASEISEMTKEVREMNRTANYKTAADYCGCYVTTGMSDRLEMALHSATVRVFKPQGLTDMEAFKKFDDCGSVPVV
jgi:hypothetical protein